MLGFPELFGVAPPTCHFICSTSTFHGLKRPISRPQIIIKLLMEVDPECGFDIKH